ncbi:MAG: hypothetical protein K0Q73_3967, partial [Paenibacillus sp.]|nr:hypothetical protein [Paenibacillus sp.]
MTGEQAISKPNIVLITTDSQRWDTLSCMGSPFARSPNLDRLAREGVLFMNAHTASPVCSPARCSLLTGVHAPVHGCVENGIGRQAHLPVFPDLLKEQGYINIIAGKAHFGPLPASFDVAHTVTEKHLNANDAYTRHIRLHGFSRVSSHPNPVPEHLFMDSFIVDTTIQEIERAATSGNQPFFAFCSLVSPHSPIDPPGRWASLYTDVELPEINAVPGESDSFPKHMKMLLGLSGETGDTTEPEAMDEERRLYYGLAAYCDDQIGRLIRFLNQSGLRENTLIIFSSDHGQQLFDHEFNDKHNYYDSTWRVPFIMSMPGTLPCGETRGFAVWTDITASILAAAGTSCSSMQGFDLFTPLSKGEQSPRRCAAAALYKSVAL